MLIRPARPDDAPAIWSIIAPVIRAGETYTLDPEMSEAEALAYWTGPDKETFVAVETGEILGTYYMRANQAGGGRHVCNCGYMTRQGATGRGIARRMAEHSLDHARARAAGDAVQLRRQHERAGRAAVALARLRDGRAAAAGVPASGSR